MVIKMVDCKTEEMINIKIELTKKIFIVVPVIKDKRFSYMQYRLMNVRKKYMKIYLDNPNEYKDIEGKLYNEMKDTITKETKRIYRTEGIKYYAI